MASRTRFAPPYKEVDSGVEQTTRKSCEVSVPERGLAAGAAIGRIDATAGVVVERCPGRWERIEWQRWEIGPSPVHLIGKPARISAAVETEASHGRAEAAPPGSYAEVRFGVGRSPSDLEQSWPLVSARSWQELGEQKSDAAERPDGLFLATAFIEEVPKVIEIVVMTHVIVSGGPAEIHASFRGRLAEVRIRPGYGSLTPIDRDASHLRSVQPPD